VDAAPVRSRAVIAVVAGDPVLATVVQTQLEWDGHAVVRVRDAASAFDVFLAGSSPPDVVIVDVAAPGAFDLVRRLAGAIRVLSVGGRAGGDEAVAALAAGADDHLVRPIRSDELRLRLERLVPPGPVTR
jgi:DNA-binding response OmpR family regulator